MLEQEENSYIVSELTQQSQFDSKIYSMLFAIISHIKIQLYLRL